MGQNIRNSLNNSVSAALSNNVITDSYQGILIYQSGPLKKYITQISASYAPQDAADVGKKFYGRLVVCTGSLVYDESTGLFFGPLPNDWQTAVINAGQIMYDIGFVDNVIVDFGNEPLIVDEADTINICIGRAWKEGDAIAGLSYAVARLNAIGYTGEKKNRESFPYPLR